MERGEFDNLPGAGKPLPNLDANDDGMWWVRQLAQREQLDFSGVLPPALQLRKEAKGFPESLADLAREESVREVLEDIGSTVLHLGPLGSGATAKLCNQIVVAGTLASLGEALALARRSGLDIDALITVLQGGLASSEVLTQKQENLRSRSYPLGGSTDNQVKVLLYATDAASNVDLPSRMVPVLLELFEAAVASGRGQEDHAAVQEVFLESDG